MSSALQGRRISVKLIISPEKCAALNTGTMLTRSTDFRKIIHVFKGKCSLSKCFAWSGP